MTRARPLLVALLLLAAAAPASAQVRRRPARPQPEPEQTDRFDWNRPAGTKPKPTAYEKAMAEGDLWTSRFFELRRSGRPLATLDPLFTRAEHAYERAIGADPTRAEPHYRLGLLIFETYLEDRNDDWVFTGTPNEARAKKVLIHLAEFERLAPLDPRIYDLLFERAILATKVPGPESYSRAIGDYGRSIAELKARSGGQNKRDIAINLANMGEVAMMAGDLETALATYRESLEIDPEYSSAFGYAVTLDRDGQAWKAREIIRKFATEGALTNYVDRLTGRNPSEPRRIFYVPPGEVHYYFALIHDALGNDAFAIAEYEAFVQSGDHKQFHARARANIADLRKRLRAGKSAPRQGQDLSWWREASAWLGY